MTIAGPSFALPALAEFYARGGSPVDVVAAAYRRVREAEGNPIWITLIPEAEARDRAKRLEDDPSARSLPLFGVPFAVKDNIDAAGTDTTAACPAFAYRPERNAAAVQRLLDAGAILIGKTNLDQFATGLVGTRSPYGEVRNAFNSAYVSGGSSSGSAVAVALGQVSFSLGTDTAGSGRVPAALNNIVGLKPTCGRVSTTGMLPACRSLDCVSVFALTCSEALRILEVIEGHDAADPYSRRVGDRALRESPVIGIPGREQLEVFGDSESASLFAQAVERMERLGARIVSVDLAPFRAAGELLYGDARVAERYASLEDFLTAHPDGVLPVTREIIEGARRFSAADAFRAQYRLAEIAARTAPVWERIDALALPTTPTVFTREQVAASPVKRNAELGIYATFVNLLDLAAVAVPSGLRANGVPFGISLVAPAGSDRPLCALGERFHALTGMKAGATQLYPQFSSVAQPAVTGRHRIAVVGAHLSGQPLNKQLTERNATLVRACRTAPLYKLFALPGVPPARPGLVRDDEQGGSIELEVWEMGAAEFGSFVAAIAAPLGIGTLRLEDGAQVQGFLCETYATRGAEDITSFGGWRAYLARGRSA